MAGICLHCSIIVDKIDANNDSFIDLSELKNWIQFTQRRYIDEDVDRQWRQHNKNKEDFVQWEVSTSVGLPSSNMWQFDHHQHHHIIHLLLLNINKTRFTDVVVLLLMVICT